MKTRSLAAPARDIVPDGLLAGCLLDQSERDQRRDPDWDTQFEGASAAPVEATPAGALDPEPASEGLQKWRLKRVARYVDDNIGEAITLADLAGAAGLSRMYFAARFRAATGLRPHDYVLHRRIGLAKQLLRRPEAALAHVALDVGFQTQAHFTTVFKKLAGTTPGRWRTLHGPDDETA